MTTDTVPQTVLFPDLFDKPLFAKFNQEQASSDGGAVLLKAAERVYGLVKVFARCLSDKRAPEKIRHTLADLIGQRIFGIACGHPDCNDAEHLADDPIHKLLLGRELTDRQHEVLEHIREHIRRWGLPPSRSELAQSLGLAFGSAVNYHLKALERKGWIQLNPGKDRGIQLLREGTPVFDRDELPEVAAGTSILADESKAVMRVPDELAQQIHPQADFYVVVRGDSMSCVGYRTGDIIAIKRTPNASEGDIVMARIGTEITLKCFHRLSEDRVELRPCSNNPEHCAIVIDEQTEDWEIIGVIVGAMIGTPASRDSVTRTPPNTLRT